jgi:outer membrane protein assembly factor BamB
VLASPLVHEETLYIGSNDHYVYAVDTTNGKQRWKFDTGSAVMATAAIAQGVVCVGGNQKIYGLDARTGNPRWIQPAGSFFQSRVATDGSTFYLGGWDNTLYALDVETGHPRWTRRMGRTFYYSPAIASPDFANGRIYICSNDNMLHAVDVRNGDDVWAISAPKDGDSLGYSSPVVSGNTVYVAGLGQNGDVYAYNIANGGMRWRNSTGQTFYDSSVKLAPDGKSLAIMGLRGKVSVLDTANGRRLWGYELGPGNIFSTPEYDGSVVYTVTMANDVQALNAPGVGGPSERRKPAARR